MMFESNYRRKALESWEQSKQETTEELMQMVEQKKKFLSKLISFFIAQKQTLGRR